MIRFLTKLVLQDTLLIQVEAYKSLYEYEKSLNAETVELMLSKSPPEIIPEYEIFDDGNYYYVNKFLLPLI